MGYRILAPKISMGSAMKLRDAIENCLGWERKTILVSTNSESCDGHNVLFRYGASYGKLDREPNLLNTREFNSLCVDKKRFTDAFREVSVTPVFNDDRLPENSEFPVMIRETLTGSQGQGITIVHDGHEFLEAWKPGCVWTKYWKFAIEIRAYVFVAGNLEVRIYKKTATAHSEDFFADYSNTVWSLKAPSLYPKAMRVISSIKNKMLEMGGVFAALDMIYVPELRDYVLLEGNSGPWLSESCARWLAELIVKHLEEK